MSRNLGQTDCHRCGRPVHLTGTPRRILREDTGATYFNEFKGMIVAEAECSLCAARYLAWVDDVPHGADRPKCAGGFRDLSYRSTFDDEPGPRDLPGFEPVSLLAADLFEADGDGSPSAWAVANRDVRERYLRQAKRLWEIWVTSGRLRPVNLLEPPYRPF